MLNNSIIRCGIHRFFSIHLCNAPLAQSNYVKGFNIIELIIVLAIMVIIAGFAAPSFASLINKNRLIVTTNTLHQSLNRARSTAITTSQYVHICPLSSGEELQCKDDYSANTSWSNGWLIFVDYNRDSEFSEERELLSVVKLAGTEDVIFNQRGRLRYFPNGTARSSGFYLCGQNIALYRHVYLLHTGRARINDKLSAKQKKHCSSAKE